MQSPALLLAVASPLATQGSDPAPETDTAAANENFTEPAEQSSLDGRVGPQRIALLVRDGVHRAQVEGLMKMLDLHGHDTRVLADRLGSVLCSDGSRLAVDASLRRWPAWYFDSAVRFSGAEAAGERLTVAEAAFLQPASDGSTVPLTRLPWPVTARRTH